MKINAIFLKKKKEKLRTIYSKSSEQNENKRNYSERLRKFKKTKIVLKLQNKRKINAIVLKYSNFGSEI